METYPQICHSRRIFNPRIIILATNTNFSNASAVTYDINTRQSDLLDSTSSLHPILILQKLWFNVVVPLNSRGDFTSEVATISLQYYSRKSMQHSQFQVTRGSYALFIKKIYNRVYQLLEYSHYLADANALIFCVTSTALLVYNIGSGNACCMDNISSFVATMFFLLLEGDDCLELPLYACISLFFFIHWLSEMLFHTIATPPPTSRQDQQLL